MATPGPYWLAVQRGLDQLQAMGRQQRALLFLNLRYVSAEQSCPRPFFSRFRFLQPLLWLRIAGLP